MKITTKPFLLLFFISVILVSTVSGIFVSPAKFTGTLQPGQSINYAINVVLKDGEQLREIISDCPDMINPTSENIGVIAPLENGVYTCKVSYHIVGEKIQYSVGVPVVITITGGTISATPKSTPTEEVTPTVIETTQEITPVPTPEPLPVDDRPVRGMSITYLLAFLVVVVFGTSAWYLLYVRRYD